MVRRCVCLALLLVALAAASSSGTVLDTPDVNDDMFTILVPSVGPWSGIRGAQSAGLLEELVSRFRYHSFEILDYQVAIERLSVDSLSVDWAKQRRRYGQLPNMAILPVDLARELSTACFLVDFDKAPVEPSGLPGCDLWDPLAELGPWWRLLDMGRSSYEEAGDWSVRREAARITGTSDFVIVLFEPPGIAGDIDLFLCRRTTTIRRASDILRRSMWID